MKKKTILIAAVYIFLFAALIAAFIARESVNKPSLDMDNKNSGNIMNGNFYISDGQFEYYSSFNDQANSHIYRCNTSENSTESIFEGFGWNLNLAKDYLYFTGNNGPVIDGTYNIIRISLETWEPEVINTGCCGNMFIYNTFIYYVKFASYDSHDYSIYRLNLDGTNETLIAEGSFNALVYCDQLYFIDPDKNICRAELDGTDRKPIVSDRVSNFIIANQKIIYANTKNRIYMCNPDGSDLTGITSCNDKTRVKLNALNERLYIAEYNTETNAEGSYKYTISSILYDGSDKKTVYNGVSKSVYFLVNENGVVVYDYNFDALSGHSLAVTRVVKLDGGGATDLPRPVT
jgi:hypothetical protein